MRNCPNAKTPVEAEAKGTEEVAESLGGRGCGRAGSGGPRWREGRGAHWDVQVGKAGSALLREALG